MNEPYLIVRRNPYEEPYTTQLEIFASNGTFVGRTDIYCNVEDLAQIGNALKPFPRFIGDEYRYEYGSPKLETRFYRHFLLRAYTINKRGYSALQISINLNQDTPEEGSCLFSIICEPWSISRLADLFLTFSRLEHLEFKWVPNTDIAELYTEYQ